MRDVDMYAATHWYMSSHGSGRGLVLVKSGAMGTFAPFEPYHLQGKVIEKGDQLTVLNETNGPGGMYTELCRSFCVGCEPDKELADAWKYAVECQHLLAEKTVPGASCKDLYTLARAFMVDHGYAPPSRSFMHGQGYSLVERPSIRLDDPWDIVEGMNIAIHPVLVKPGRVWCIACDNYIVGAERLLQDPRLSARTGGGLDGRGSTRMGVGGQDRPALRAHAERHRQGSERAGASGPHPGHRRGQDHPQHGEAARGLSGQGPPVVFVNAYTPEGTKLPVYGRFWPSLVANIGSTTKAPPTSRSSTNSSLSRGSRSSTTGPSESSRATRWRSTSPTRALRPSCWPG